jgi:hypothetical protein
MGPQVDVQRDSLLKQSQVWDQQSEAMGSIVTAINDNQVSDAASIVQSQGGTVFSGVGISQDYPLFREPLSAYAQVSSEYSKLCGQGQKQMQRIDEALVQAYKNYDATEAANIASANNAG